MNKKGTLFGVFWAAFLVHSITLAILTVILFINEGKNIESNFFVSLYLIVCVVFSVVILILDYLDKNYTKAHYAELYKEHIKRAVQFKAYLNEDFGFTSLQQYEMIFAEATTEYQERQGSINQKRDSADKLLWGIIIASIIAIVPSLITGVLDNIDKIESINKALIEFAKIYILVLIPCIVFHQGMKHSIRKNEDQLWSFSQFTDTIQIIVQYEKEIITDKEEQP